MPAEVSKEHVQCDRFTSRMLNRTQSPITLVDVCIHSQLLEDVHIDGSGPRLALFTIVERFDELHSVILFDTEDMSCKLARPPQTFLLQRRCESLDEFRLPYPETG